MTTNHNHLHLLTIKASKSTKHHHHKLHHRSILLTLYDKKYTAPISTNSSHSPSTKTPTQWKMYIRRFINCLLICGIRSSVLSMGRKVCKMNKILWINFPLMSTSCPFRKSSPSMISSGKIRLRKRNSFITWLILNRNNQLNSQEQMKSQTQITKLFLLIVNPLSICILFIHCNLS